jgi:hypothetical protein
MRRFIALLVPTSAALLLVPALLLVVAMALMLLPVGPRPPLLPVGPVAIALIAVPWPRGGRRWRPVLHVAPVLMLRTLVVPMVVVVMVAALLLLLRVRVVGLALAAIHLVDLERKPPNLLPTQFCC